MRIVVAASLRASSQFANAINTVKMAQGFAQMGHDVTLLCSRPMTGAVPPFRLAEIYGLRESIRWVQLPSTSLVGSSWVFTLLGMRALEHAQPEFVYARHYLFPWVSCRLGVPTAGETHAHAGNSKVSFAAFLRSTHREPFRLLVTISAGLADHYCARGVPRHKVAVLDGAADIDLFRRPDVLPQSPFVMPGPHAVYAGHLYDYKGIPTVLETAHRLPRVQFHLVGGWTRDVRRQERLANRLELENVHFHGMQPQARVPPYLWHADVLLLPPTRGHASASWTSPVKLGEYLASGTPVVATSIAGLRDRLIGDEVVWVEPDNPDALADGVRRVLDGQVDPLRLRRCALERAAGMSYRRRASAILERCGVAGAGGSPAY